MRKYNAENERLKRRYVQYLREAKGRDLKSIDKMHAALVKFEESTKYKPFRSFRVDQARQFKDALSRAKTARGKPLALTTIDATLRLVKGFFMMVDIAPFVFPFGTTTSGRSNFCKEISQMNLILAAPISSGVMCKLQWFSSCEFFGNLPPIFQMQPDPFSNFPNFANTNWA